MTDLDHHLTKLESVLVDIRQRVIRIERNLRLRWWTLRVMLALEATILITL